MKKATRERYEYIQKLRRRQRGMKCRFCGDRWVRRTKWAYFCPPSRACTTCLHNINQWVKRGGAAILKRLDDLECFTHRTSAAGGGKRRKLKAVS